jgi:hypothetical protein
MRSMGQEIGRLALRQEGADWVAYYALKETMEGAVELGRMKMNAVRNRVVRRLFMDTMREAVTDILHEKTGVRPNWNGETPAPEHERAGHS